MGDPFGQYILMEQNLIYQTLPVTSCTACCNVIIRCVIATKYIYGFIAIIFDGNRLIGLVERIRLKKWYGRVWTDFIWLIVRTHGGLF